MAQAGKNEAAAANSNNPKISPKFKKKLCFF
jgi:hypothetical protein